MDRHLSKLSFDIQLRNPARLQQHQTPDRTVPASPAASFPEQLQEFKGRQRMTRMPHFPLRRLPEAGVHDPDLMSGVRFFQPEEIVAEIAESGKQESRHSG